MVSKRRIYNSYRKCVTARRKLREKNKQLQRTVEQLVKDLMMANRIQAHPNPPYLKSDGSLNALGQLKLYEAGTSTAKIAYTDAAGTSYGSTIDLDASALPENGPIFWDNDNLYKVEVYTRTDSVPTYALDYTVDNFGITGGSENTISTAVSWTVDGVGASSTTFATLTLAMVAARTKVILGNGTLTINVSDGTYTDETIDFTHPQGQYITVSGESEAGTIFVNTVTEASVFALDGSSIKQIDTLTLKHSGTSGVGLTLKNKAVLSVISNVTTSATGATTPSRGLSLTEGSSLGEGGSSTFTVTDWATGVYLLSSSRLVLNSITINTPTSVGLRATDNSHISIQSFIIATSTAATGILIERNSVFINEASFSCVNSSSGTTAVKATEQGFINLNGAFAVTDFATGIYADIFGGVYVADTTPTFTTVTTNYDPAADTIRSVTGGSADTALIIQAT